MRQSAHMLSDPCEGLPAVIPDYMTGLNVMWAFTGMLVPVPGCRIDTSRTLKCVLSHMACFDNLQAMAGFLTRGLD